MVLEVRSQTVMFTLYFGISLLHAPTSFSSLTESALSYRERCEAMPPDGASDYLHYAITRGSVRVSEWR